ncbi:MAG: hypothetical protein OER88_05925 [Planctomycetota bacterium]|nr:hypothetical protein [Planctomycetota bacterium]
MRRTCWLIPALLGACGSTPAPAPSGLDTGGAAISIQIVPPRATDRHYATAIVFAKLGEDGDATRATEYVTAEVSRSNVVYALDLAPGRYAPVVAKDSRKGQHHTTFLPADLIRSSVIEVVPGAVTSLGRASVRILPFTNSPDEAQVFYQRRLGPNWGRASVAQRLFLSKLYHNGKKPRHAKDDEVVRENVRKYVEPSGWTVR